MKQRLLIVFFTALVFGAGFGAHMWIASDPAMPPPPAAIGSEFAHGPGTPPTATFVSDPKSATPGTRSERDEPLDRKKLVAEVERYRSQIAVYRAQLDELDAEFEGALVALLTGEQREKFVAKQKRDAERRAKGVAAIAADTAPLSDEAIFRLQQRPLYSMLGSVAISMRFDSLNHDLKLDDAQQAKVRELLRARREKFIALVDSTPPPSILLSRLVPVVEKIAAAPRK